MVKTVSAIDIGISSQKVIDKKTIINLKYIFPNKDYEKIKSDLNSKIFFILKKKYLKKIKKIMQLVINLFSQRKTYKSLPR